MSTKNRAKHLIHTLSIDRKASNKQIARDFGKFVRELVRQQRGCEIGCAYENMKTLASCLQDEMDDVVRELATICDYFNQPLESCEQDGSVVTHFWKNTQCKGFTQHMLGGNKAVVITNDKTLQKNLAKVSSFND